MIIKDSMHKNIRVNCLVPPELPYVYILPCGNRANMLKMLHMEYGSVTKPFYIPTIEE